MLSIVPDGLRSIEVIQDTHACDRCLAHLLTVQQLIMTITMGWTGNAGSTLNSRSRRAGEPETTTWTIHDEAGANIGVNQATTSILTGTFSASVTLGNRANATALCTIR